MKKDNIKTILIHGNGGDFTTAGGSIDYDWFPYAKEELTKLRLNVVAQTFPDPNLAREKYWIPHLEKLGADENTILIGHSSGAIAAMRFAEAHKILGSILVGSYYTDTGSEKERLSGYFDRPWQWDKIRRNQKWIVMFSSTDDPWIPIEEPRFVAQQLQADYREYTDRGHFGVDRPDSNLTFPELIDAVKEKLHIYVVPHD